MIVKSSINAYDIETLNIKGSYVGICVCYNINKESYCIYGKGCVIISIRRIIEDILPKNKIILYVHNLNFDGMLVLEALSTSDIKFDILAIKTNIYYIRVLYMDRIIEWRCSYKLLPFSLASMVDIAEVNKKLCFPYDVLNENFDGEVKLKEVVKDASLYQEEHLILSIKDYILVYCSNDVNITRKVVEFFWRVLKELKIKANSQNYSISSVSINLFYRSYNDFGIDARISAAMDKYVRRSYYGGRCEVYGNPTGNEKVFHFDFKGMYSQCMNQKFPLGKGKILFDVKDFDKPGFYMIEWYWEGKFPVLPCRDNVFGKLMFYGGRGEGLYWYEEILLFLEFGGKVLKIISSLIYEDMGHVFKRFISSMEDIREKGGVYKMIGKLLINSMYGRLGMGRENVSSVVSFDGVPHKRAERFYKLNNVIISELKSEGDFDGISNVVMASIITSKARIKLYRAFNDVIIKGGRLLYSDTDSVIAAYNRNVIGEKHGEVFWDPDKKDTKLVRAWFALPKTYSVVLEDGTYITKIKGLRRNSLGFDEFKGNFDSGTPILDNEFISLKRSGYVLRENTTLKEINLHSYSKRMWVNDYTDTLPFKR